MERHGKVRMGQFRLGLAVKASFGMVSCGLVRSDWSGEIWFGSFGELRSGLVRFGVDWSVRVWFDRVLFGS